MKSFFSSKTSALDAALDYADKKIPVFPVIFYDTTKTFGSVCSSSSATTDKNIIKSWFTENPAALVAIPTGTASGIVAVIADEDSSFTAKTPCFISLFSKKTYLFKLPEGCEGLSGGERDGLAWKGDLGSVVLPNPLEIIADGELEELPSEMLAKMNEPLEEVVAAQEEEEKRLFRVFRG